jgi:predicted homoserine dehydrogenase-like protein
MIGLNYKLAELERQGKPLSIGIVGAGQMGRGLVSQIMSMKGMRPTVLASRSIDKAKSAFLEAGLTEGKHFATAETIEQGNAIIESGRFAATENNDLASGCTGIQCVIDATGVPEAGAQIAMDAINKKKHIVMLSVETDVCIGHLLYKTATEAGVVYSGSAGDEPAAVMELYDFADALGFDVLAIGKGKNNPVDYDCTPATVEEEALRRGMNPKMLCAFKDGTKTMVEMTAMANATGFLPDVPGGHGAKSGLEDLQNVLSLKSEGRGGILSRYKTVDYINGIAPGVFLIFTTTLPAVKHELAYISMGDGPNYVLYRPYHLISLETPLTAAKACLDGIPSIVPRYTAAETVTIAKRDLKAGEQLDGIGGYTIRGLFIDFHDAQKNNCLPLGLVNKKTVMNKDVSRGEYIRYDDVVLDEDSLVLKLRRKQDAMAL